MIVLDPSLVKAATGGSRDALATLVAGLQRPIFNLAIRMLADAADAEDATQEILIKIITRLGDIREPASAGAWAFRTACRHLVHVRTRSRVESLRLGFPAFAADLSEGLEDLPDGEAKDAEMMALIEQVKVGCTLALLTCLSRPVRAAYILGEILEMSDREAAFALGLEPAAFRQRLRRGRALVGEFVQLHCGIVTAEAACRCDRRVRQAVRLGRAGRPDEICAADRSALNIAEVRAAVAHLERGRAAAALMRSNPNFVTEVGYLVLQIVEMN